MLDIIYGIGLDGTAVTAFDWSSASNFADLTTTANGLSAAIGPIVVSVTALLLGARLFKRFANKI